MTSHISTESWHDDKGTELIVTCDDYACLIEVIITPRESKSISVDVIQVARDSRGLPIGCPVTIIRRDLDTESLPVSDQSIARFWLPKGFTSKNARECYYRVVNLDGRHPTHVGEAGGF